MNTTLPEPVDFLVPGVLALAVMSTAMVSLGIATGFERRYGVLKRLGSTPLVARRPARRQDRQRARDRGDPGRRDRRSPASRSAGTPSGGLPAAIGLLLIGTVAFAGIGMLMAGTLRAEANLAVGQRPVPRCSCSSAAWPTRSTGCPTRSRRSPSLLPAAALSECAARRARARRVARHRRARGARRRGRSPRRSPRHAGSAGRSSSVASLRRRDRRAAARRIVSSDSSAGHARRDRAVGRG